MILSVYQAQCCISQVRVNRAWGCASGFPAGHSGPVTREHRTYGRSRLQILARWYDILLLAINRWNPGTSRLRRAATGSPDVAPGTIV